MTAVSSMAAMPEEVEQRTGKQEQVREIAVDVCPVLGDEEEADDEHEAEECNVEAAHREGGDRKRSDKGWR